MESWSRKALQQFLSENSMDLAALSLEEFRGWLEARIEEAARQPLFQERCRARDLRRQYRSRLRSRERRLANAKEEYRAGPDSQAIEELREHVRDMSHAVEGLTQAVAENRADPAKLLEFESRRADAVDRYQHLRAASPTFKRLKKAKRSLADFKQEIGLTEIEESIERLGLERGRASGRSGKAYEQAASQRGRDRIAEYLHDHNLFAGQSVEVLHRVTLGCARGEFDQMIVATAHRDEPVRVLAVVEVKKNINDLVHGFRIRQENLAWLAGDRSGYDPVLYRTRDFPSGHFTSAAHDEAGRRYHFDCSSFQQYAIPDESGYRLRGLWFATNRRPLLGVTSAELGRILHQVSTNPSLNLSTNAGLGKFRKWVCEILSDFQTRDVLRLYASRSELARQILLGG